VTQPQKLTEPIPVRALLEFLMQREPLHPMEEKGALSHQKQWKR